MKELDLRLGLLPPVGGIGYPDAEFVLNKVLGDESLVGDALGPLVLVGQAYRVSEQTVSKK